VEKLNAFDAASKTAQNNLAQISSKSVDIDRGLSRRLQNAHEVCNELSVMTQSGDKVATRIEKAMDNVNLIGKLATVEKSLRQHTHHKFNS